MKDSKKIQFGFEGKRYETSTDVYDNDLPVVLPCGRLLKIVGWYETCPPKPVSVIGLNSQMNVANEIDKLDEE